MPALTAAVVLVGLLGLLNLLLTFGVIRRLRQSTADGPQASDVFAGSLAIEAGHTVGLFVGTDVTGAIVDRTTLAEPTLIGFFSPGCDVCHERLPEFLSIARTLPAPEHVIAVVSGDDGSSTLAEALRPVARMVLESPRGPLAMAFRIRMWPAFVLADRTGFVLASGGNLDEFPVLAEKALTSRS